MLDTDNNTLQNLRKDYQNTRTIQPNKDPFSEFQIWFNEALNNNEDEPNVMTLATVDSHNMPYTRIVLLKDLKNQKFTFFTNYKSSKAKHIEQNNNVSLTFWWQKISRAVHIQGKAQKTSTEESNKYFNSRPKANKIGAIVSKQSSIINNLDDLINEAKIINEKYKDDHLIPKPDHWGGYEVDPCKIEFWKGLPGRLHERIRYDLNKNGLWTIQQLAP
ncbi:MAG: pyridoxamine 5'-phosphate oxidase [Solitalea-like symbiont of Acarus siro]